ncbi:hypothetical protein [Palaeococcus ferrophilus]|uniref:hypothetical protein n=1 Tax=Palaeococcus ferrophilus TaxID=83868 RepID=UPI00064FF40F|nr:hypothetical protein [Palaeococcus ferrophilus]
MTEIQHIKIGEDRFRISEDEVARRELKVTKVDEGVIQVQEEVHGIVALVGATSSVNIKKEELKELIKIVKEEFGWNDIC